MGICGRQGLWKLRHIDTRSLWIQQKLMANAFELRKVRGEVNPADLFTKHLSSEERITNLMRLLGLRFSGGRAETAPKMKAKTEAKQDHETLATDMVYELGEAKVKQEGYEYLTTAFEGQELPEAYLHDERLLPHMIRGDFKRLFPRAVPCEERLEDEEQEDWLEARHAGQKWVYIQGNNKPRPRRRLHNNDNTYSNTTLSLSAVCG